MKRKKVRAVKEKTDTKSAEVRSDVLAVAVCLPGRPVQLAMSDAELLAMFRKPS